MRESCTWTQAAMKPVFNGGLCILLCQLLFSWLGAIFSHRLFFFKVCKRLWAFVFPSQLDVFWNAVQQTTSHLNVLWSILLIRKESKRHFQCCRHLASCGILMTRISSLQVPVMSHAFSRSFFNIAAPLVNKRKEYSERRIIGFV